MAVVKLKDIFGTNILNSYSEFYLALCIGAECGRRGLVFDMSEVQMVDNNLLSTKDIEYFRYLRAIGSIFVRDEKLSVSSTLPEYYFDVSIFTDLLKNNKSIIKKTKDYYEWEHTWIESQYGYSLCINLLRLNKIPFTLMHTIAFYIMSMHTGNDGVHLDPKDHMEFLPLFIKLNVSESMQEKVYLDIVVCQKELNWFKSQVTLEIDKSSTEKFKNIDYIILFNQACNAGRYKLWSITDKVKLLKEKGIKKGSVVSLFRRVRVKDSSLGKITAAQIAVINEIREDTNTISLSLYPVSKTQEEIMIDYFNIDEDYRTMYSDLIQFKNFGVKSSISITSTGIFDHFKGESNLIECLDKSEMVSKTVTIDGKLSIGLEMSAIDAVYWILREYNVDFDREWYRQFYNDGKEMLYDLMGGTPNLELVEYTLFG